MVRSFTIFSPSPTSDAPSGPHSPPGAVWQSAALKTQAVIWVGTSTAPLRTSNEIGQAGTLASYRSRPSGWPTLAASIGVSPTMSTTQRCDESETPSPTSCSLSIVTDLSSPEICSCPDLPLSMSWRPARLAIPAAGLASASLPPDPASLAGALELLCFGFAGATFAPCGSAGAGPGGGSCARGSLVARATAKSPQIKQRKRRVIGEL